MGLKPGRWRAARGMAPWVCRCGEQVSGVLSVKQANERAACCGGRSYGSAMRRPLVRVEGVETRRRALLEELARLESRGPEWLGDFEAEA